MFLPLLPWYLDLYSHVYILIDLGLFPCIYSNRDLDFTMISLIDLGLFPCIYSNRDLDFTCIYSNKSKIILMYPI
jgi:hypothetical protein